MRSVSKGKTQNRTNGLNLHFVVGLVAEVHHRTIGRLWKLLLKLPVNYVHCCRIDSILPYGCDKCFHVNATTPYSHQPTLRRMGNVDCVGVFQHGELVSRVTKMLNPTDLVLPVVHETLVKRGKMRWPLHHHVGLLLVALETGNEVELTRLWSIPLWSEIVLYRSGRAAKKHERSLSFWTRYSSLRPNRIVILGWFEANEEWLCVLQSRIKNTIWRTVQKSPLSKFFCTQKQAQ